MSEVDNWTTREAYYHLFFAWFASCKPPFCMRGIRWGGEEDENEELTLFQGERLHYCGGGQRENYGKNKKLLFCDVPKKRTIQRQHHPWVSEFVTQYWFTMYYNLWEHS
jgi:hypothetical protein